MTTRTETTIAKVRTDYGPFYIQVDHVEGRICGIAYKQPEKFEDSRLDGFINAIVREIDGCVSDIRRTWDATP